jgi:hypothetical protein
MGAVALMQHGADLGLFCAGYEKRQPQEDGTDHNQKSPGLNAPFAAFGTEPRVNAYQSEPGKNQNCSHDRG